MNLNLSALQRFPSWLIRGQANTPELPMYDRGTLTAPTSGTYTLLDDSGASVVTAAAVTVTGQVARYTLDASLVPTTRPLSWYWQEVWSLVIGGETLTVRRSAWVVIGVPYQSIQLGQLESLEERLVDVARSVKDPTFQVQLSDAWEMLMRRLIGMGRRPPQLLDGWQLADWHRFLTLWAIYNGAGPNWRQKAADYWGLAESEEKRLKLNLDFNEDGRPQAGEENMAGVPQIVMTGGPRTWGERV